MKKFFAVIGNPPYQTEPELGSTRALPIYDKFMDEAQKVGGRVELVTPGRFLFDSGQTSSEWNKRMLADRRLSVMRYEADSSKMFPAVDIKGGVAVTYWAERDNHDPIGTFIPIEELKRIAKKAAAINPEGSLTSIAGTQCNYNFDNLYKDHPEYSLFISGEGRHSQLKSNALERVPIFTEEKEKDDDLRIFGLAGRQRVYRWCPRKYIDLTNPILTSWKVIVPASNGSGAIGEVLSTPLIGEPLIGFTQTFISFGFFESEREARNCLKYIKSRFCRVLLGIAKNTQHNPPITWRYVPLQDFTSTSDIDWTQSVADVDRQLYAKYGLSPEEIEFIETHVKEMS